MLKQGNSYAKFSAYMITQNSINYLRELGNQNGPSNLQFSGTGSSELWISLCIYGLVSDGDYWSVVSLDVKQGSAISQTQIVVLSHEINSLGKTPRICG